MFSVVSASWSSGVGGATPFPDMINLDLTVQPQPPNIFKVVHYETCTVWKRTFRIQLKCLLVLKIFLLVKSGLIRENNLSKNNSPLTIKEESQNNDGTLFSYFSSSDEIGQ